MMILVMLVTARYSKGLFVRKPYFIFGLVNEPYFIFGLTNRRNNEPSE